jgi:hypothetical protein
MAKAKGAAVKVWIAKPRKRRPGVHSKKKNSCNKSGKHWNKPYAGQGR